MDTNEIKIRPATEADAAEILNIYAPYITDTAITFEYDVPTLEEFTGRIRHTLEKYPYLVAEQNGKILGYAYVGPFHDRAAYDWAVESTIYCAPDARGFGVGDTLYRALLDILDGMGYWNVYALVADPNPASERIHARLGFTCVGREPHTAYKFGWLGLSTWWLPLRRGNEKPEPTHPLTQEQVEEILGRYQA